MMNDAAQLTPAIPETKKITRPEVRDYVDVLKFLQDIYEWRKARRPSFSYTLWADELGFKSRSFVRLILVGQRSITQSSIPLFVRNLGLQGADAEYFELLVEFNQAATQEARQRLSSQLQKLWRSNARRSLVADHFAFLSSQIGPRLYTLLTLTDLERTVENLAAHLNAKVKDVQDMLENLERQGMAKRLESDGRTVWESATPLFEVKDRLGDQALEAFHRRSLEEAIKAVDLDPQTRNYQSLLLPLSKAEYAQVQKEASDFLENILARFAADSGAGRRLYQVNFNLVPASRPITCAAKSASEPKELAPPSQPDPQSSDAPTPGESP